MREPRSSFTPKTDDFRAGGEAALGIYGKSSPLFQNRRRENYDLQWAARQLRRGFPVAKCLRWIVPKCHVNILYAPNQHKAFYAGLETCGSVWECPVCAAKISERRRVEILAAITAHKAAGGDVLLLTLTNPHAFGDDLKALTDGQRQAMRRFWGTKAATKLCKRIGLVGSIRALEVVDGTQNSTGNNGWHPHFHILLFVDRGLELVRLRTEFYAIWANACRLAGMKIPSLRHGVTLQDGKAAVKYVTKWGLEHEMTKGHIKKGRKGGRTPFDLLRAYRGGDKQAGALFVEYANAFKGKRQLVWSPGLKAHFKIEELNDLELAEREEEEAEHGCELSRDDWQVILQHGARAEFLEAFEQGGAFEVANCLAILRGDVPVCPDPSLEVAHAVAADMGWGPEKLAEFLTYLEEQRNACT